MPEFYVTFARKITKIPGFYMIFGRKIFSHFFGGGTRAPLRPDSYAYAI